MIIADCSDLRTSFLPCLKSVVAVFFAALNFQEKYQSWLCTGLMSIVLFNLDQPCCLWVAASVHLDERYSFPSGKKLHWRHPSAFAQEATLQQCCICKCAIHWRLFVLDCWCVCESMSFPHSKQCVLVLISLLSSLLGFIMFYISFYYGFIMVFVKCCRCKDLKLSHCLLTPSVSCDFTKKVGPR